MTDRWTGIWMGITHNYAEVERLMGEGWIICRHTGTWQPPTDIYESDDGLVVQIEVAGMRSEDFSISLAGQTLVIAGVRTDVTPKRTYYQMEIRFGEFRAEITLPWPVKPENVEASYEDGFLKVRLPCPQPQRVPVIGTR